MISITLQASISSLLLKIEQAIRVLGRGSCSFIIAVLHLMLVRGFGYVPGRDPRAVGYARKQIAGAAGLLTR